MSNLTLEGTITEIKDTEQVSDSFSKRIFVIEYYDGSYPQNTAFEALNDRIMILNDYKVDDRVRVHFNSRSREWNGKWFTNLVAWKIERC